MAKSAVRAAEVREPRILVVDDLGYAREALAALLRSANYEVAVVGSGAEALDELARNGADLVLSDIYMPRMTGWELAHEVRARGVTNTRGLPICIGLYSALLSGFSREQLTRAEVDFAVTKLTDPDAILDAIERALAWSEVR